MRGVRKIRSQLLSSMIFAGTLVAAASVSTGARADTCAELSGGTCKNHGTCDSGDTSKHCRDTLKRDGYHCECRTGKDNRSHDGGGPNFNLGISFGTGHHGWVGFDVGTGGYCDSWGCPGDYWDYPIFYGPVYWDGEWYEGPLYYRERHGRYEYYLHGDWHRDEWRGERPDWVGETHYGPAKGRDFYKSDEFRSWGEKHRRHGEDGDHHEHGDGDHHEHGDGDHGDHWKDGDEKHDKDGDHGDHAKDKHDGDKDQDKDHDKGKDHDKNKDHGWDKDKDSDKDKDHKGHKDH